jgi:aerobic carbon-monoxide dehydrogenase medium subunit
MKPPPFRYVRVDDAAHAVERLGELGDEAKVLAGGQSLLPMMGFRLVRPAWLVDVGRADDLRGAHVHDGRVRIGALTRHRDLATLGGCPVIAETVPLIAHEPIRTLGTFGGSVAHADSASEWCLVSLLLDGEMRVVSDRGARTVGAEPFFVGTFTTDLAPDELLTEVSLRVPGHAAVCEHARRRGDYGLVLVGVAFDLEHGRCARPRVVAGGVDAVPVRLRSAEAVLEGAELDAGSIEACAAAAADEIEPGSDVHATAEDRRAFTAVLVRRALERARDTG